MRLPAPLKAAYEFVKEVLQGYSRDNGALMAAAVSFYVFLSLIPMLLVAVALAGYFLGSPEQAQATVLNKLRPALAPGKTGEGIMSLVSEVVGEVVKGRGAATGLGLLVLLWTGTTAVANLGRAINLAWKTEQRRSFIKARLVALLTFVAVGVLLGASFGLTAAIGAIKGSSKSFLGIAPGQWPWIWSFLGYLVPLLVTIGTFTIVYEILPNTRVRLTTALIGGVFAGIMWEAAKQAFSVYVNNFANFSKVYGSLGGIILLLVWINYSAMVTILGAEVAAATQRRRRAREAR